MSGVRKTIAVLHGDGIGPEVTRAAVQILSDCAKAFHHEFIFKEFAFGGDAIDRFGTPLPAETLAGCKAADAVLLGAIGGPKWDSVALDKRPEAGLLKIRKELGLYINLRPIKLRPSLRGISPLKRDRIDDCDMEIVRELAGDIYFGAHEIKGEGKHAKAHDVAEYSAAEVERVARYAFDRAAARNRHVTSVDKANVLATSTLWRQTVNRVAKDYPDITLDHMYVDNAAMQLLLKPAQFDVILCGNMFGDILSDEASAIAGSIGLIPSMSRGDEGKPALYEPIHGSAPTLAGKDVACPLGAIYSASLMLHNSFGLEIEAQWIESAVDRVLDHGYRTIDIMENGGKLLRCSEFTDHIRAELSDALVHSERYGWGV
jgi:3-isopropylmalate dehydrogenase